MTNCIDTIDRPYGIGPVERAGSTIGRVIDRTVTVSARGATTMVLTLLDWALQLIAITYLFRADAKAWFNSKGRAGTTDPNIFS